MSKLIPNGEPPRILIVDDSSEDRQTFRRFLTKDCPVPYAFVEAVNAAEARQRAAMDGPQCVLLDFNLPDGDGLALLQEMIGAHGRNAFGLVMLTGSGETSVAVEALKSGAHDYLEKNSLTPLRLQQTVANAISRAALYRQVEEQSRSLARKNEALGREIAKYEKEIVERIRAQEALHEKETQLRLITDNIPINLGLFDRDYRYRFVNETFARRWGRSPEEFIGRTIPEMIGQEMFDRARSNMDRALAGERVDFELAANIGGTERWMRVSYMPEKDTTGVVTGFIAVSSDISDRKKTEIDLERARDQAVIAIQARDNFLAALSHELRTPLNPVLLVASEAANDTSLSSEVRKDFADIRDNVEQEARLIDDLLDLSRITHGKLKVEPEDLDLQATLRDALTTIEGDFSAKGIRVTTDFQADFTRVWADPTRLRQVFWNVLKNAVKFTPSGGLISITTSQAPSDRVVIVVRDTGIGIAPHDLLNIFEAFAQGDHAAQNRGQRFGGLGLGLAISRRLIEMHGGTIRAESAGVGRGATFTIELPATHPVASLGADKAVQA